MIEPVPASSRSIKNVWRIRAVVACLAGVGLLGLAWIGFRGAGTVAPASRARSTSSKTPSTPLLSANAPATTVRIKGPEFDPWPPKAEVVGPPAGSGVAPATHSAATSARATPAVLPEPAAPSSGELRAESLRDGDQLSAEGARDVLLDDKKSSALKLAVIDKLRTQDPEEAVPVLVAFLEHPASPAAAYTKPTAVKALSDFRDPRADLALERLARSSPDERVRLTIAAFRAKERSR